MTLLRLLLLQETYHVLMPYLCVVCYCVSVIVYFMLVKGQMVKVGILVTGTCKQPLVVVPSMVGEPRKQQS